MLLRCTTRLLAQLGEGMAALVEVPPHDDDWYANLLWLDRRKSVLLTHAGTLFPVLIADVRKRDLQPPGPLIAARIGSERRSPTRRSRPMSLDRSTRTT